MQALLLGGLTRVVKFVSESTMNKVFAWISAFFKRKLIGVWMMGLTVPERAGVLKEDAELFLKNSAYYSLQAFFSENTRGVTVFWTPEKAGKTYILSAMETKNKAERRFVYVDFKEVDKDAKKVFYAQIGLDSEKDTKPLSQYLHKNVFFTFIFDHFDKVAHEFMVSSLAKESVRSSSFNLLIMVNNKFHARSLLMSCGQPLQRVFVRLLGPPFCGRWFASDLGGFSDPRYNELVDRCGTLIPMISIRNCMCSEFDQSLLDCIENHRLEWDKGERLLGRYRVQEV